MKPSKRKVLAHDKAYGDTVVLIGQCKGADMATAFGSLRPDLVQLVIGAVYFLCSSSAKGTLYHIKAQAGSTQLPVATGLSYKGEKWRKMDEYANVDDLEMLGKYFILPEDFSQAFKPKYGTFVVLRSPGGEGFLWSEKKGDEGIFEMNYRAASAIKAERFPIENINKLHYFNTLDDRNITPSAELAIEMQEFLLGDLPNCHVHHFHSGHLSVLPEIPVVHKSNMNMGQLKCGLLWSSNVSATDKIKEANEYRSIYRRLTEIINNNL